MTESRLFLSDVVQSQILSYHPPAPNPTHAHSASRTGHWTEKENAKYYAFLKIFRDKFDYEESRREWKVFKALAKFVKTRSANQCRSHHHKMNKNSEAIQDTLDFLARKWPNLPERSRKYEQNLRIQECSIFGDEQADNQQALDEKEKNGRNFNEPAPPKHDPKGQKTDDLAAMRTGLGLDQPLLPAVEAPENVSLFCFQYSPFSYMQLKSTPIEQPQMSYETSCQQAQQMLSVRQRLILEAHQCFIAWQNKMQSLVRYDQSI